MIEQAIPPYVNDCEQEPDDAAACSDRHVPTPEESLAVAFEAASDVARIVPWVGPLVEAALLCPPQERRSVRVYSEWLPANPHDQAETSPEKHEAYCAHVLPLINAAYPWLMPLLDAAKAMLLIAPGMCCFTVHSRIGVTFDIPQIVPLTHLTPFPPEAGDTIH